MSLLLSKCRCATEAPHADSCPLSERNKAEKAARLARGEYLDIWEKIADLPLSFTDPTAEEAKSFEFRLGPIRTGGFTIRKDLPILSLEHADRAMDICIENSAKDDKVIEDREFVKFVDEELKAMGVPEGFLKPNIYSGTNATAELLKWLLKGKKHDGK